MRRFCLSWTSPRCRRRAALIDWCARAGEKPVRDKAVASLSRFLSAGRIASRPVDGAAEDDEDAEQQQKEEELPVGELKWDEEWTVDARLAPDEMAKLWKGIFYCALLALTPCSH